jgi:hypothetical protein
MARARFKEGVEFYDKFQYEQARAAFLQAYALKKHPAVLLNLAWSCLKSGHALEAERYFKQFLADSKDITEKQRADANDGLKQSQGKIGRIEVIAPGGTEVTIDGERVGAAPLPESIAVEPGAHTVTFKGPDSATETQSVTVLGGDKVVARSVHNAVATAPSPPAAAAAPGGAEPSPEPAAPPPPKHATREEAPAERPEKGKPKEASGRGLFDPPANVAPVVIGGLLTAAGAGVAIAMIFAKQSAKTQADNTARDVISNAHTCNPPDDPTNTTLVAVCNQYNTDIADVNTDATVGNIALGVAVAAFAGTFIYWLAADKGHDKEAARVVVAPLVSQSSKGMALSLSF